MGTVTDIIFFMIYCKGEKEMQKKNHLIFRKHVPSLLTPHILVN